MSEINFMEQVLQKRKARKQKEENKGNFVSYDFEEYEMLPLVCGKERKDTVFRILGKPLEVRQNGTDVSGLYYSQIVKDDKKGYMHVIWKSNYTNEGDIELDKDWILFRLYDKIMERRWVDFTEEEKKIPENDGKKGRYVYLNKDKPSYRMIMDNSKEKDKYPPKFFPRKRVVMNVIDRHDDWCKKNKHTKVLFSKVNPWETPPDENGESKTIFFKDAYGIPMMAYDEIMDKVVPYTNWEPEELPVDVVMYATGKMNSAYDVRDAQDRKISEEAKSIAVEGPSSDEELAYEKYDFDIIFPVCSYSKLRRNKIALFKQADLDFGTKFEDELNTLADEERARMQALNKSQEDTSESTTSEIVESESAPVERKSRTTEVTTAQEEKEEDQPVKEVSMNDIYPYWNDVADEDRKDIENAIESIKGKDIVWNTTVKVIPCDNADCATMLPDTVMHCPKCNTVFE